MIRIWCVFLLLTSLAQITLAQKNPYFRESTVSENDSLIARLEQTTDPYELLYLNRQLGLFYAERDRFRALEYLSALEKQARALNQNLWLAEALSRKGYVYSLIQNYPLALSYLLDAREVVSNPKSSKGTWHPDLLSEDGDAERVRKTIFMDNYNHFGILSYFVGDYEAAIAYYKQSSAINDELKDEVMTSLLHLNTGESLYKLEKNEQAKSEFEQALVHAQSSGYVIYVGLIYHDLGRIYEGEGDFAQAEALYKQSIQSNLEEESPDYLSMGYLALSNLKMKMARINESLPLAQKALVTYQTIKDTVGLINAHYMMATLYDLEANTDSAYYYLKKVDQIRNAHNREGKLTEFQSLGLEKQMQLKNLEVEKALLENRIRIYVLVGGIIILVVIVLLIYRSSRQHQRDKTLIEKSLSDLKSTQDQLVQQEKLASLGQLTAGIAHEIKNPLNFVTNFSELSVELVEETKEELLGISENVSKDDRAKIDQALLILEDIKSNISKIHTHGTRADSIVKAMLQHSKGSDGKKEPTDLNALVKEYVNLSYHGMRAGKNPINVDVEFDLDDAIGEVPLIAEDFSRVIVNLTNNAFDACREKLSAVDSQPSVEGEAKKDAYAPKVRITTKLIHNGGKVANSQPPTANSRWLIAIEDNGPGIPAEIKDKILQPFFTTKKGTDGTGLGLSITNDIVKAHGGRVEIESEPNKSTFIIIMPNAKKG